MTVSAFSSVSLHPPLVQISVGHEASAYLPLSQCETFVVNILGEDQEPLSRRFAAVDSTRRFDGLAYSRGEFGNVLLEDALAHIECRVVERHTAGDHTIIIGEAHHGAAGDARPLLYYRGGYAQLER
jgi:flavin reductase (DIM6/NTAB) family NADH-FMN oxidoreductase RutF